MRQVGGHRPASQVPHPAPGYLIDGRFQIAAARPLMRTRYRGDHAGRGPRFARVRPTA
ncbi:MAG: hypothetical protein AVDCRST_MAG88-1685 [uncultured Thermomicrobiales bacterium]|uniref:Uncharacterized protein n=1 Tax=uncultured Thermomicrobiales bacterium TaxID=1645740 RepID=A0A6J4UY62_9BACT|nr:MAG: hypothetical protein AVDCRST_MAG88-1685 [uncultured Thermomicrobiales bacterium]